MRALLGSCLAAAGWLVAMQEMAFGAGAGTCNAYVAEAVAAAAEAKRLNCGFDPNDPRWTSDEAGHMRWCRASRQESVDAEIDERRAQLDKCRYCTSYTEDALDQARSARRLQCGFDPGDPRWSENPGVHMSWCMASRTDASGEEQSKRGIQAHRCSICRGYADLAIEAVAAAAKLNCLGQGARWSPDPNVHYSWCMALQDWIPTEVIPSPKLVTEMQDEQLDKETGARLRAVESCRLASRRDALTVRPETKRKKPVAEEKPRKLKKTPPATASVPCIGNRAVAADGSPCRPVNKLLSPGLLDSTPSLSLQGPLSPGAGGSSGGAGSRTSSSPDALRLH